MASICDQGIPVLEGSQGWEDHVVAWQQWGEGSSCLSDVTRDTLRTGCSVIICTYCRAESVKGFLESLPGQRRKPEEFVIVDASPDDETEKVVKSLPDYTEIADRLLYIRVTGPLRGLTRQRNFGLRCVGTDLVAFFDDDMALGSDCLYEMEQAHRQLGDEVVGVCGYIENEHTRPPMLWRMRRALGLIPSLRPGSYARSGMSVSWNFQKPTDGVVEGDWLPGGATMWKTSIAREVGFNQGFRGYCNGEDVEFSLRAGRHGKLVLAGKAHLLHFHVEGGRPNAYQMGYRTLKNLHHIHQTCLPDRTWRDAIWFYYAFIVDTFVRGMYLARPGRNLQRFRFLRGRVRYLWDQLWSSPDAIEISTVEDAKPKTA